jgi:hypothetical protein
MPEGPDGALLAAAACYQNKEDVPAMALFYTDSLALCCATVQTEKEWWIATFDCKGAGVPSDWDCLLPSDVALKLPGSDEPTIGSAIRRKFNGPGMSAETTTR